MEQVLNALNRQNIQVPVMEGKRLVLYNERNREAAIRIAGMQRTHGMQIQCMRMEEGLKAEDYIASVSYTHLSRRQLCTLKNGFLSRRVWKKLRVPGWIWQGINIPTRCR